MVDRLRTLAARVIVRHFPRARSLVVAAWSWLAAETDDLEEKRRCLEEVLGLDPDNESARMALLAVGSGEVDE
jgi:hypothetical protein